MRKGAGGGGLALLTFSSARSEGSQSLGGLTSPPVKTLLFTELLLPSLPKQRLPCRF